jgi:hypothetical protein
MKSLLVLLLLGAAYLSAQPWLDCAGAVGLRPDFDFFRICTFGFGIPVVDRGHGGMWFRFVLGVVYLGAAIWLVRSHIPSASRELLDVDVGADDVNP